MNGKSLAIKKPLNISPAIPYSFFLQEYLAWFSFFFLAHLQGFVKVVKNKAYFKRFQTKLRRRRGKCTGGLLACRGQDGLLRS